jgi:hypothetical protein
MTAKQRENWEKTRLKGRSHFIRFRGVLFWGVSLGLVWPLAMAAVKGWHYVLTIPVTLILFPFGGYFWGAWTWKLIEARYEEATRTRFRG